MDLPPLQTHLSGFQWVATKTCVLFKHCNSTITILLPKNTNLSLCNALDLFYNLFIQSNPDLWLKHFPDISNQYVETLTNLITQAQQHPPSTMLKCFYVLKETLRATPGKLILGIWDSPPLGNYTVPKECVYHKAMLPITLAVATAKIYIPAIAALCHGQLSLPTVLFKNIHDKISASSLQHPTTTPADTIDTQLIHDFAASIIQHLQDYQHTNINPLLDPTLEDLI